MNKTVNALLLEKIELQNEHKKRLHRLEVIAAARGIDTEPHVLNEIDAINLDIAMIDKDIAALQTVKEFGLSTDVMDTLTIAGRYQAVIATSLQTVTEVSSLKVEIYRLRHLFYYGMGFVILILVLLLALNIAQR